MVAQPSRATSPAGGGDRAPPVPPTRRQHTASVGPSRTPKTPQRALARPHEQPALTFARPALGLHSPDAPARVAGSRLSRGERTRSSLRSRSRRSWSVATGQRRRDAGGPAPHVGLLAGRQGAAARPAALLDVLVAGGSRSVQMQSSRIIRVSTVSSSFFSSQASSRPRGCASGATRFVGREVDVHSLVQRLKLEVEVLDLERVDRDQLVREDLLERVSPYAAQGLASEAPV